MKKLLGIIITLIMTVTLFTFATVNTSAKTIDSYIVGDVDMDGYISIKDATLTQTYISKLGNLSEKQVKVADCDDKEGLQITDATIMQIYVAKMSMDYPENVDGYKIGDTVKKEINTLIQGEEFRKLLQSYNKTTPISRITFDKASKYSGVKFGSTVNVDSDNTGEIKLSISVDGTKAFVLSDNTIYCHPDSANMFSSFYDVQTITFNNFDTSLVTNMKKCFHSVKN